MPVYCEALSVIIYKDAIKLFYNGGLDAFMENIPNDTLCDDGEIVRLGFMDLDNAIEFLRALNSKGLKYNRLTKHIAVFDQREFFLEFKPDFSECCKIKECRWLEFAYLPVDNMEILMCWYVKNKQKNRELNITDEQLSRCSIPPEVLDGKEMMSHYSEEDMKNLKYLRSEDGLDVFWDEDLQKEIYTTSPPD